MIIAGGFSLDIFYLMFEPSTKIITHLKMREMILSKLSKQHHGFHIIGIKNPQQCRA